MAIIFGRRNRTEANGNKRNNRRLLLIVGILSSFFGTEAKETAFPKYGGLWFPVAVAVSKILFRLSYIGFWFLGFSRSLI